jgi:hypothetical protein
VLTLAEADAEFRRLARLGKNHAGEQYTARRALRELPDSITRMELRGEMLRADLATAGPDDRVTVGGQEFDGKELIERLGDRLDNRNRSAEPSMARLVDIRSV